MSAGGHFETRAVNIYSLSRLHEEVPFNLLERHASQKRRVQRTQAHEIESLRLLTDALMGCGLGVADLDGFFFSYRIPQIGKEFDLLKLTDRVCLNIELKSAPVPEKQILSQLLKNRHYLSHLGRRLRLFTAETGSGTVYTLTEDGGLKRVPLRSLAGAVRAVRTGYAEHIDGLFRASDYLVSPIATPERFIRGEYFLTPAQEEIKRKILRVSGRPGPAFIHITGRPGTGKTLLLYDLAKTLAASAPTLLMSCSPLLPGQELIGRETEGLTVASPADRDISGFAYILTDETHRLDRESFEKLCRRAKAAGAVCIFSSDPEQVLSTKEKLSGVSGRIGETAGKNVFTLSEKLRTNADLTAFISQVRNLRYRPKAPVDYSAVSLCYANTTGEAQELIAYFRAKGYVFINYTRPDFVPGPYSDYEEDFDTHHVIGREFDRVLMLMDSSFCYDSDGRLQGIPHPNPDLMYPNLFYQGVTRVREELALIVVRSPELFEKIASIVSQK
ncbi:MAG: ATP-binding protein [Oscillospiraceae bacterium]|nr:ATP-binding protein [Oscillospiraceae bacterium]